MAQAMFLNLAFKDWSVFSKALEITYIFTGQCHHKSVTLPPLVRGGAVR